MELDGIEIHWLGHSGFKIVDTAANVNIFIDPFQVEGHENEADVLLITHSHFDHCSIKDIKGIIKPSTIIIAPADCQSKFSGMTFKTLKTISPGMRLEVKDIIVEAVPAYNKNKQFHPVENDWVGYVVHLNKKRIYHCGDSDFIPEMNDLKGVDVALMAVSGKYVMTAEEAANACNSFQPKLAIPMHYGTDIIGTPEDAERFKSSCNIPVEILDKE